MGSGDGEWIRAEPHGESVGEEPGFGEDDSWPRAVEGPAIGPSGAKRWGRGGVPGPATWVAVTVAAVAAVSAGLFMVRSMPTASTVAGVTSAASGPTPTSAGSAQLRMALSGRVLAVSRTSITINGEGASVTAAVTGATTVTGRVHRIGGVKAGDKISAQLSGTPARLTAIAIQDLAGALAVS